MDDLVYVFAEGFMFLGKLNEGEEADCLEKAVRVEAVNVMTPKGPAVMRVMSVVGNLQLIYSYPRSKFDGNKEIFAEYVKLTTGIEVPTIN